MIHGDGITVLIPLNRRLIATILSERFDWWNDARTAAAEMFYPGRRNLEDDNLDREAIWRLKRADNAGSEDKSNSRIFYGTEFDGGDLRESMHDRSKRSRRSSFVADLNHTDNQQDILENQDYRTAQIVKGALGNSTAATPKPEETAVRSYSNGSANLTATNAPNGTNASTVLSTTSITRPRYPSEKKFSLHDYFVNPTLVPSGASETTNKTDTTTGPRYFPYVNGSRLSIDDITHRTERTTENRVPMTSPRAVGPLSATETLPSSVTQDRAADLHPEEERSLVSSTSADPAAGLLPTGDDANRTRGRSEDRRNAEELSGVTPRRADDERSSTRGREESAGLEFPRGNRPRGFAAVANESRCCLVETTTIAQEKRVGGSGDSNGTGKESREPILGVIKVFEPRGRPEKQGMETTAMRLSRLMGEDGKTFTGRIRRTARSDVEIGGESRNANGEDPAASSPSAIDPVAVATARPEVASAMTPRERQRTVPSPSDDGKRSENKSNGNSDTDEIDRRVAVDGSSGNETVNVRETARSAARPRGHGEFGNNLRRKLLWVPTIIPTDTEDEDVVQDEGVRSIANDRRNAENGVNNERGKGETMLAASPDFSKISSALRGKIKREKSAAEGPSASQNVLKSRDSDANRHKRGMYPSENHGRGNAAMMRSESAAAAKEAARMNHDEKREDNDDDYLNQNAEELRGYYSDREEDVDKEGI